MKTVKIFGSGCCNCETTFHRFEEQAKAKNMTIQLEKVTDIEQIMEAGILATPGVMIDGKIKHTGSVPDMETVTRLLAE
ncbi:hypothetical protein CI610_00012 [invertebrate metagenome]|uniref:Thioredoxin-like fold domain-containing protein n=1 Tax=invertebrate metagenome TaxID=1711999 RepID=A0A2H9TCN9_9ZZZZ